MPDLSRRELIGGAAAAMGTRHMAQNQTFIEVAAYYFPQYHPDARNDSWHGQGWTEWDLLKAAHPRFPGHDQPKKPAWGHFDESDPKWAAREIDLAADHGITTFLYDWYWYENGPFLQHALENGFLKADNNGRIKFALMWANHDWLNIHPASFTNRPETLAKGTVSAEAFGRLVDYVVKQYFARPNYLRIDNVPYFSIYELGTFIAGVGGLDAARRALDSFRATARASGFTDIHLNAVLYGLSTRPKEVNQPDLQRLVSDLGISSLTTYAWVHHYDPNEAGFPKGSYTRAAERNYQVWEETRTRYSIPYHPNVSMGWDSSPRTVQSDRFESRGYPWTAVLDGNTPSAFQSALEKAREFATRETRGQRLITLNAWNEWTEGSYLLPDARYGSKYLHAVRSALGPPARTR